MGKPGFGVRPSVGPPTNAPAGRTPRSLLDETREPDWNIDCNGTGKARKSTPFGSVQMWSITLSNVEPPRDTLLRRRSGVVADTPPRPMGDLFRFCWPFSCSQAGLPGFCCFRGFLAVPRGVLV